MLESDDDSALLRRYADEKSEEAFAALVRRHLDLVYSVALRQVNGDTHLAQDVAQAVFTALARKAASLAGRPVLGGWLYRTAQFTAIDLVRTESRRRAREQEASTMHDFSLTPNPGGAVDWEKLRPTLDRAIGELSDDERDAVVLRFFEGKSFADVGAKLRLTENTARMRVERALDKLHALLARHGVTSTTAALAVALANQPAVATPFGLASIVTGTALASSGATAGAFFAFMSTSKITLGVAGLLAALGLGTAFVAAGNAREAEAALTAATARQAVLSAKLGDLENRVKAEAPRLQRAEAENSRLLGAVTKLSADGVADAEPIDSETVMARFKHAQELVKTGDPAEALREALWCYDVGLARVSSMFGVRYSGGVGALAELAERYPPARAALVERRDKARQAMLSSEQEFEATMAFGSISHALKDSGAIFEVIDHLPPGDRRRSPLESLAYEELVEVQRYSDALEGRPYGSISSQFENSIQPRSTPASRSYLVKITGINIEVLAGAGDLAHARALAERLLAYDGSESTRSSIQQHAARAGHRDLLSLPGH